VVVYSTQGEILLLKRCDDPTFWQSVTGSLLQQENEPASAALRELKEETGLTLAQGTLHNCAHSQWFTIYPHWRHRYPEGTVRNLEHVFCFEVVDTLCICLSQEHSEYVWLSRDEALKRVKSHTNQQAIEQFVPTKECKKI
jgi:dATP pyrophosphohydrolase